MREEDHVVQVEQFGRHIGFVGEDVEPRTGQSAAGHQLHERVLVHDAAPGDVDQVALGAQRLEPTDAKHVVSLRRAHGPIVVPPSRRWQIGGTIAFWHWYDPSGGPMSDHEVKMIILSTDDLDESIKFYSETLGMALKFRDGAHFAALDGGAVTLALATAVDHPIPGQVVIGIKTADVDAAAKAVEASGGGIVKGPYDDAHERRAVVYDNKGNGLVFYSPLAR